MFYTQVILLLCQKIDKNSCTKDEQKNPLKKSHFEWIYKLFQISKNQEIMRQASTKDEEMEQLVKSKGLRDVGLLDHIDEAADAIENSAYSQEVESDWVHIVIQVLDKEDHHPSHEQVEKRVEHSGNVVNVDFGEYPKNRDSPYDCENQDSLVALQYAETNRGIAPCNQHVNHAVVQFFQDLDPFFTSVVAVIYSTGQIKHNQAEPEDDSPQDILHCSICDDPICNQGNGPHKEYASPRQMSQ